MTELPADDSTPDERRLRPTPVPERYHGLDLVRAAMMSLGVVLHVGLVYIPEGVWIYNDPDPVEWSPLMEWLIHTFRMSAFFVMAGFFGAMLLQKGGTTTFLRHRFVRIVVPLIVGSILLYPLMSWSREFANTYSWIDPTETGGTLAALRIAGERMSFTVDWPRMGTGHLWFLYDLVWLYAAAVLLSPVLTRLGPASRFFDRLADSLTTGAARFATPVILILVSFMLMLGMNEPGIDTNDSWYPDWYLLLTYSLPFGVGWIAWHHRSVIGDLKRWWWVLLLIAAPLLLLAPVSILIWHLSEENPWAFNVAQFISAAACWMTILALAGCSERFLERERASVRYMVDASYWIYLAHMPLTIFIPALMRYWNVSGLLKMTVSIAIVMFILLATYHLLVRNTPIGIVLNGRRYPAWPFGGPRRAEPPPTE